MGGLILVAAIVCSAGTSVLPTGSSPAPIEFKHFPDRLHAFVWRNWEMVSLERMAEVLGTTPEKVRQVGESMGLPAHRTPPAEYQQRGYITIIRRNWHLLPYEQLLRLLDWDAEKLAFTLREDDFLWVKLGNLKPACATLRYAEPNEAVVKRCEQIKALVSSHFADEFATPPVPRFDFIRSEFRLQAGKTSPTRVNAELQTGRIRFLYSYCGVFGDPLLTPELDPYPDGLLQRLSDLGVNGVWLHVVLRQLAPGSIFPEFGAGHERRIENLRRLVERAKKYGIDIYLYMNEPRAMEASFFKNREEIKGVQEGSFHTLCTSAPEVRQWLTDSLTYVFKEVPGLGGVFTITASENLTNCYSHSRTAAGCPRCSKRPGPEVIAEVNKAIAAGVWAGNPKARVIVWDWGWPDASDTKQNNSGWTEQIINALPDNVYLMSVSEWSKPIVRGGVATHGGRILHLHRRARPSCDEALGLGQETRAQDPRQDPGQLHVGAFRRAVPAGDEPRGAALRQPGGCRCRRPHAQLECRRVSLAEPPTRALLSTPSRGRRSSRPWRKWPRPATARTPLPVS